MTPEEFILAQRNRRTECPWCSPTRRTKGDRCLSLKPEHDRVLYNCWHCGVNGVVFRNHIQPSHIRIESEMQTHLAQPSPDISPEDRPLKLTYSDPTERAVEYLRSRCISQKTAQDYGLMSTRFFSRKAGKEVEGIAFPYKDGYKVRAIEIKDFIIDGVVDTMFIPPIIPDEPADRKAIICEGEMDALSWYEAGYRAWSIPHGALNPGTSNPAGKLDALSRWIESEPNPNGYLLALDADDPGVFTSEEIARRIGREVTWLCHFSGGKDANDVIRVGNNPASLIDCYNLSKPYPVSGLWDVDHFNSQVKELYIKGLGKGLSTGYSSVDELYTVQPGQLSVVTGVPSSGKSEFVDQLMINLATQHNLRFAVASFENPPAIHIAKLAAKRERKPFFTGPTARMNEHEYERSIAWVRDHFYFLHDEGGDLTTIESILERLRAAVKRYGVSGVVIDPYNYIARPMGDISETQWISDMLSKVCAFARANNVHVWFVAHPAKMLRKPDGKVPVPGGYDISGSAAWFAKADCGLTIHRPDPYVSNDVELHVWKCRFSWIGKQGVTQLTYSPASYTYEEPKPMARNYGIGWELD